ncbi:DUF1559 domain-containing protein [Singulisphaera sp. GP187]|uniref:DUF1559 family PulG-like putative transporter n=1 Tax=Singulisphaera sp. GP187 TaxID=1882752 RepID=UPI0009406947|nr:DUF1559 domain-containing protein [Singulisphaera sp. GP187]
MRPSRFHFSLSWLMAAVALVAIGLAGVGLFRENQARAEREPCRGKLRNLAMALKGYQSQWGAFPPGTVRGDRLVPERRLSWVILILNWTDYYQSISFLFDPDLPWDSETNILPQVQVSPPGEPRSVEPSTEPPWFPIRCPAHLSRVKPGMPEPLVYVGIAGLGTDAPNLPIGHPRAGIFGYNRQTRTADLKDGASSTMMLAETTAQVGPWTAGGPSSVRGLDPNRRPYLGRGRQFGGTHRGGAMIAMADGSVHFLRDSIAPSVFEAPSTVAGGESLPVGWDR